jgi:hypothetical protein
MFCPVNLPSLHLARSLFLGPEPLYNESVPFPAERKKIVSQLRPGGVKERIDEGPLVFNCRQ